MREQRIITTRIDDMLELLKDYVVDIGPNSKALTIEFNPQLQQLALVFADPDCPPSARTELLTKFNIQRVFSANPTPTPKTTDNTEAPLSAPEVEVGVELKPIVTETVDNNANS